MPLDDWSTTAGSNLTVGGVSIAEGMSPGGVNNAIRGMMAEVATYRDLLGGKVVSAGTADAQTVTTGMSMGAYAQGVLMAFEAGSGLTNTGAMTINVDGIGAKSVKLTTGANPPAGAITAGGIFLIAYEATSDTLLLLNPAKINAGTDLTGDLPFANLTQLAARSLLGVAGNATADVAAITAGTDHQVMRRSGTSIAFGALNLAQAAAITGALPIGNGGTGQTSAALALAALGGASVLAIQAFTANGTYTPTAGMKYCLVIATGGGGGGGGADSDGSSVGAGGGGAGGSTCIELFDAATIGASKAVTIGTGGTAGADTGGNGGDGGDTALSTFFSAEGGGGGTGIAGTSASGHVAAGGAPTAATGGLANIYGGYGLFGMGWDTLFARSGAGGASFWGGGGRDVLRVAPGASAGVAGLAYGSGGSGAANVDTAAGAAGGTGADGFMLIIELA